MTPSVGRRLYDPCYFIILNLNEVEKMQTTEKHAGLRKLSLTIACNLKKSRCRQKKDKTYPDTCYITRRTGTKGALKTTK